MLTPNDWRQVLDAQSACNLQGIVRAALAAGPRLLEEVPTAAARYFVELLQMWVERFDFLNTQKISSTDALNRCTYSVQLAAAIARLTGALPAGPRQAQRLAHSYARLWAEQFLYLSGQGVGDVDSYYRAHREAAEKAGNDVAYSV